MITYPENQTSWQFPFFHPELGRCRVISRHNSNYRNMRPHEYTKSLSRGGLPHVHRIKTVEYNWDVLVGKNDNKIGSIKENNGRLFFTSLFNNERIVSTPKDKTVAD